MILSSLTDRLAAARSGIAQLSAVRTSGQIRGVNSVAAQIVGLSPHVRVGDQVLLEGAQTPPMVGEVVSIHAGVVQVLTFDPLHGVGEGDRVSRINVGGTLHVADAWLGRVIDPLGRPLDGKGALPLGATERSVRAAPPPAVGRARLGSRLDLGVAALDLFTPCRQGQRVGLFAGSGIGKSTLLAMLARDSSCDVVVVALVGERGREVREFLEDELGTDGLARAVVVVATSDMPPLMRRQAGYAAMAIAEFFRDRGMSVLLLVDSISRFCQALREIALATGEAPATRGFPASVFAELPRLLERAGPGPARTDGIAGQMTAFFTVLVEGDDHNEPVADAARGLLDGHVIMDRKIAEAGRYPPIDVLRSVSRTAPGCLNDSEAALIRRARAILALHANMADIIRLGAYSPGTDPALDEAIRLAPRIEDILRQAKGQQTHASNSFFKLNNTLESNSHAV